MSHDRGCYCGREKYEYDDCPDATCDRRSKEKTLTIEDAHERIEKAVGDLYGGLFILRSLKQYNEEYFQMGVLMNMLMKDRAYMRNRYQIDEEVK